MIDCIDRLKALGVVVVIPTYNNHATLLDVIDGVSCYSNDIIVVNDGSTDGTADILAAKQGITLISYTENRGKGHALKIGLRKAAELGYRYAITIDSDGQHYSDDIPSFIDQIEKTPDALIVGARNLTADNMPGKNTFANKFSNFWFKVETGITLQDTQSGYRLYPLKKIATMWFFTPRYEFELEVIVRSAWKRIPVINIPVKVFYPSEEERVSHFRPLRDFTRISILNTFLVTIALLYYYPISFFRALTKENIKRFIRDHITHSKESNLKITFSVGLGIFFGIVPLWGWQMISAGVTAHLLRLNKVIAVAVSNISIPPMIPFILYGSMAMGGMALNKPTLLPLSSINIESISGCMFQYVVGSILLAVVASVIFSSITFVMLNFFRRNPL
ncbi:DUF2062 domain-containing protein [uncultured Acetobacteroides sp.]|uniref:DUF2062 domain-containing protein n=1 Tax=uncultured Acetobacteroides sp. TaxID=1760811 RepID=UPI0029F49CE9|nr:DUF2062 domain-containing protein [uncultured Acetobacteroides sp.]